MPVFVAHIIVGNLLITGRGSYKEVNRKVVDTKYLYLSNLHTHLKSHFITTFNILYADDNSICRSIGFAFAGGRRLAGDNRTMWRSYFSLFSIITVIIGPFVCRMTRGHIVGMTERCRIGHVEKIGVLMLRTTSGQRARFG